MPKAGKRKTRGAGSGGRGQPATPLPAVFIETTDEGDRLFVEALKQLDRESVPAKAEQDFAAQMAAATGGRKPRASSGDSQTVDLHGLTLDAATRRIETIIQGFLRRPAGSRLELKIITGKGLHSGPTGSVLAREIHAYVRQRYALHIARIEASPADVTLGGVPLKGHFMVSLIVR